MKKVLLSLPFALGVSIALVVVGSVVAGNTTGTPNQFLGACAAGLATGISGIYTGLAGRRWYRKRHS